MIGEGYGVTLCVPLVMSYYSSTVQYCRGFCCHGSTAVIPREAATIPSVITCSMAPVIYDRFLNMMPLRNLTMIQPLS